MGNSLNRDKERHLEATIVSFKKCTHSEDYKIFTSPYHETSASKSYFLLRHSHPNFQELFDKISKGKAYKFTYKYFDIKWSLIIDEATIFEIINIEDCEIHTIEYTLIIGFVGIDERYKCIQGQFLQILMDNPIPGRFLIAVEDKHKLVKQQRYDLKYTKFYLSDFYIITGLIRKS